ncbi:MAG TPA: WD40 repeat domain-containing protein, partial [Candidatus Limnocylindrales bacterium]
AVLLDAGSRGDLWDVPTCRGNVNGGSLTLTHGLAAALEWCSGDTTGTVQVVDVKTRALVASLPGWDWQQLAVSPDGTSFVGQEARGPHESGPLAVADARTGSVKVELQGMCWWNDSSPVDPEQQAGCKPYPATPFPFAQRTLRWSPDGSMIVAVDEIDQAHQLTAIWDARDGRLLHADSVGDAHLTVDARFSPDSRELVLAHPGGVIETLAADAWTTSKMATLDQSIPDLNDLGLVGYSPDGSSLIGIAGLSGRGGATIVWIDPTTLSVTNSVPEADAATPKSAALSPNGASLAVGATDGSVRIWDAATGHLLQQMQFGSQVQGVAFIDDSHLAVAPYTGDLLVMTIDPTELANTVRASVIRPFTQTECTTYAIDPCPTLAQSKAP